MTAIAGTYSDLKFIKSRSVAQVVVEVPIERAADVVALFGTPQPGGEVWVGMARLKDNPNAAGEPDGKASGFEPEEGGSTPPPAATPRTPWSQMPPAQQAGIRCADPKFMAFLTARMAAEDAFFEAHVVRPPVETADAAADVVREVCRVQSRAELMTNKVAAVLWRTLDTEYQEWAGMLPERRG